MSVRLVSSESRDEVDRAIAALTLAFVKDPMARWMYPEPEAYLEHFPGFTRAFGGRSFENGTAWVDEAWGGAALWYGPDVAPDGDAIGRHVFATTAREQHPVMGQVLEKMEEYHPEDPHWYLSTIGVDAAHQGRGLGAQLMDAALVRCDEAGLVAYLESSNPANIPLYERHGFRAVGEIQFGDSPLMTPMLRPAR